MDDKILFWDPVSPVPPDSFQADRENLLKKANTYIQHPWLIRLYVAASVLLILSAGLICVYYRYFNMNTIYILAGSSVPFVFCLKFVIQFQDELALFFLCEQKHWLFNPDNDKARVELLKVVSSKIFNKGYNQKMEDQVWGSFPDEKIFFWTGLFTYTVSYGRSSRTYHHEVFGIRLPSEVHYPFSLVKPDLLIRSNIKTESEEFNKLFSIQCDAIPEAKITIMRILSPSVQVRIIDFARKFKPLGLYFEKDTMFIEFGKKVWDTKYTSFMKNISIDLRDVNAYYDMVKNISLIPSEMIQYIE